ncbi:MAG: two-component regulator propeller domain-containing protein [Ferruginibacter sp.]
MAQLLFPRFATSQKQNLKFDHLTTYDGLAQSDVLCILQDKKGFMWFGTSGGLNKYDGYNFTLFKNVSTKINSISSNFISCMAEDSSGALWIGTRDGLNRFDSKKNLFTRFMHDKNDPNSISSNYIVSLTEDSFGLLWISTSDGSLDVFDPAKNVFTHYKSNANDKHSLSNNETTAIVEDSEHNMWIGTAANGLNLFNRKKKNFTRFQHNNEPGSLTNDMILSLFEDSKHNLWIGTNGGGMNLFNRQSKTFSVYDHDKNNHNSLSNDVVYSISEDDDGNLWIATESGGLNIFEPALEKFQTYLNDEMDKTSLSNNSIQVIKKNAQGDMWIGTFNAGINLVKKDAIKFNHIKHSSYVNSLSSNYVLCIYEDSKENLWIGTDGEGLNLLDRPTGIFTQYRYNSTDVNGSLAANNILSIAEDRYENLWIGTDNGITVFNKSKNTFKQFKNDPADSFSLIGNTVWQILADKEKNIWVAVSGDGLCRYDHVKNSFTRFTHKKNNLSSNKITCLFDTHGFIWIGTDGIGLNRLNKKTNKITQFKHDDNKNSISNNSINCFHEDKSGNLWIGTDGGLNCLNGKTNLFSVYTMGNGLPDDGILGILEDSSGNLWISTNRDLTRFNPATRVFNNIGIKDKLQLNEYKQSNCRSRSGAMYFGGINGFNEFFPDDIKQNIFDPPLLITNFKVFNKDVPLAVDKDDPSPLSIDIAYTKSITLPYKSSVITFEFASLNYTAAEKKQYAYMLENFDKEWNYIGTKRTATYTNLDPGKYIFKVRGMDNEGAWSPNITTMELNIIPPFWLTWWFKAVVLIGIIGAAFVIYISRVKTIKVQKRKLEQRVRQQTQQLIKSTNEEQRARREVERVNEDLERKNKEMEQFAYIASHDLQEPLRTTSAFMELLQQQYQGKLDEKGDKYFNFILEATERMKGLIKNLLDFSRIGNKKELERVDCDKVLHNVLADLGMAISEAGARIHHDRLPTINGYAIELKQLFQNLITNAIKFREKEIAPEITITAQEHGDYWEFAFKDNGIGIEEKHFEKIFAIFQRLHSQKEYQGSGIGLSHCKKIVELHHGRIWVVSIPKKGSTFYFTIHSPKEKTTEPKIKLHNVNG